jgi:hypothetical protein
MIQLKKEKFSFSNFNSKVKQAYILSLRNRFFLIELWLKF